MRISVVVALLVTFASAGCVESEPSVGQSSGGIRPPGALAIVGASPSASTPTEVLAPLPPAHLASFTPPRVLPSPSGAASFARTAPSAGARDRRPASSPPEAAAAAGAAPLAEGPSAARGPVGEDSLAP